MDSPLLPIEIKSSRPYLEGFFSGLNFWRKISGTIDNQQYVIYRGTGIYDTKHRVLLGWDELEHLP